MENYGNQWEFVPFLKKYVSVSLFFSQLLHSVSFFYKSQDLV